MLGKQLICFYSNQKGKVVMVAVDSSIASSKTVRLALQQLDKTTDKLILIHIYSSWDYLNDEKNEGKIALEHQRAICEQLGVRDDNSALPFIAF